MKSDIYTKIMLAVIALNLTVLTALNITSHTDDDKEVKSLTNGESVETETNSPTKVVITGVQIEGRNIPNRRNRIPVEIID